MSDKKTYEWYECCKEYQLHGTLCRPIKYEFSPFGNFHVPNYWASGYMNDKFHLQEKEPEVVYEYLWEYKDRNNKWSIYIEWLSKEEAISWSGESEFKEKRVINIYGTECKRKRE